jgi:hypothetical protein
VIRVTSVRLAGRVGSGRGRRLTPRIAGVLGLAPLDLVEDAGAAPAPSCRSGTAAATPTILLIAAAVIWILVKQVKAAPVKARLLVLAPLIMGYFGVKDTPASTWKSGADLGFIVVGALLSIGLGLWRGTTIRVWRENDGVWWRAGSKYTLYLWGALFVVRVVLAGAASATGHEAADGLGPILFALALSFAAQNAVIGMRMTGAPALAPVQGGSMPVGGDGPARPEATRSRAERRDR